MRFHNLLGKAGSCRAVSPVEIHYGSELGQAGTTRNRQAVNGADGAAGSSGFTGATGATGGPMVMGATGPLGPQSALQTMDAAGAMGATGATGPADSHLWWPIRARAASTRGA